MTRIGASSECVGNVVQASGRCALLAPIAPGNGELQASFVTGVAEDKLVSLVQAGGVTHDQIRRFAQTNENSECSAFFAAASANR